MDAIQRLALELGGKRPFVPKGVYRFKTHEEADEWETKMLTARFWQADRAARLAPAMKSLVNLDEHIGKSVGRRRPPAGLPKAAAYTPADARAWQHAFGPPTVPRGVYRFASHEEADAWLMRMITRVRKDSNPASQPSPTSADSDKS